MGKIVSIWYLPGSLKSKVSLTDEKLKKARGSFAKDWARNPMKKDILTFDQSLSKKAR